MASKRIGIMDLRQIIRLKLSGRSNRFIAISLGVHRNTVNHYVKLFKLGEISYESLLEIGEKELHDLFPSKSITDRHRYEELSTHFEYYRTELKKPGCTRLALWNKYLIDYPEGYGYTQFNEHFNRWLGRVRGSGKLDHRAGDKLYIDYTGKKLSYVNKATGEVVPVEVFVAILPCSNYTFVQASRSQKKEDFIESMNDCLSFYGGVPEVIVTDNLKSAVNKSSKYEPILNKTFKDFGLHYGCAINPTRAYSPQDKALVEGAVKLVYQRIFYPMNEMTFFSLDELNGEINRRLGTYNDYLLSLIKVSRRQQFESIEQAYLSALPTDRYEIKSYKRAKVQKMGYIFLSADKNYYSVPYRHIGKRVEVRYDTRTVEIYFNSDRLATHPRSYQAGKYITIDDHLSSTHKFYQSWSPDFFSKRAASYGPYVVTYIEALIAQSLYPETAYKQCLGIFQLYDKDQKGRLNKACQRGLLHNKYGYHILKNILKNNMDRIHPGTSPKNLISDHENIRGPEYFDQLLKQSLN